jgi:Flp pilus assembly protein TadD
LGKYKEGVEHCSQSVRLKPDYAKAHNNLAIALVAVGRISEAIEHLQEALRLAPDYPEANNNLGNALVIVGKNEEAIAWYNRAVGLQPDDPWPISTWPQRWPGRAGPTRRSNITTRRCAWSRSLRPR